MKLSAILIGAAVASDYDYDALGNKKSRAPSEIYRNCWPKYEATCDFLPNNDYKKDVKTGEETGKNNAADMSGPTGLITLTHMQCDDGDSYVKLAGNLSCPNCDSEKKNKHGFHVHAKQTRFNGNFGKDLANDCSGLQTGGHFFSAGQEHGPLNGSNSHNGAMGNIIEVNGHITVHVENKKISLDPRDTDEYIGGRSLSMHENDDDGTNVLLGGAGPRIGCCNITPPKHFCKERHATCDMRGVASGAIDITEVFCKDGHSWMHFGGEVSCPGCSDEEHGFHVHQGKTIFDSNGNVNCHKDQTKSHFSNGDDNGTSGGTLQHGHHDDHNRHYGAIANVQKCSSSDVFKINVTDGEDREDEESKMSLVGDRANISGRTMVLHAKRDVGREDPNNQGSNLITFTGNAGPRIGCCEIKADGPSGPDPSGWCGINNLNKYFGVGDDYIFNCKAGKSKCAIKCRDGKKKCSPKKMKCKNGKPSISKVSGC